MAQVSSTDVINVAAAGMNQPRPTDSRAKEAINAGTQMEAASWSHRQAVEESPAAVGNAAVTSH